MSLKGEALAGALAGLPEWSVCVDRDAIQRRYQFADFKEAFAFMTRVAAFADEVCIVSLLGP
jgi:4a-hydroxytetrahydrobiopterin dehydratase